MLTRDALPSQLFQNLVVLMDKLVSIQIFQRDALNCKQILLKFLYLSRNCFQKAATFFATMKIFTAEIFLVFFHIDVHSFEISYKYWDEF